LALERNRRLTSLPSAIGDLDNLSYLYVSHNDLTSLPATIGNLSSLPYLSVSDNALTSLPATVGNLGSLQALYANNNQLSGNIQPWASGLKVTGNLHYLGLSGNQCLDVGADTALANWLDNVSYGWRDGCP
jgi:hypothetical protein